MSIGPGHPAYKMPPRPDDQIRKAKDIVRAQREQAASRSLESSTIASGQLTVSSGGSIVVDGGALDISGSDLSTSGNIVAGGDIEADTLTSINNTSVGADLDVLGTTTVDDISVASTLDVTGGITAPDVYTHLVASSPRQVYVNSTDGRIGNIVSSRRYKQDITGPVEVDDGAFNQAKVVRFRYIEDVKVRGEDSEYLIGGIAEQFHEAGLDGVIEFDDDGIPLAINDRALLYTVMAYIQKHAARIREMEEKIQSLIEE